MVLKVWCKLMLLLCASFKTSIAVVQAADNCTPEYCWKDYKGVIPRDAVPAGRDTNGDMVYVGQAYIRHYELLPVTIYPALKIGRTTAYAKVLDANTFVKILCSPNKQAFEWIATTSAQQDSLGNWISGGSEIGENLKIGRVFRNNGAIVGKVFRHELNNRGIWFPLESSPANSLTFELLRYNCDKLTLGIDLRIDDDKV